MKKNLRNILALSLGLMTTVAFAQDWGVDSRTRVNMHGDNDMSWTEQRATIGVTWGGSDWGIHASSDVNFMHNDLTQGALSAAVYEAYASTDLMGYANLTVGRKALDYGSGAIISSNQWAGYGYTRTTYDGMILDLGLDIADITFGYTNMNDGLEKDLATSASRTMLNIGKAEGDWSANLLYVMGKSTLAGMEMEDQTAMGIDLSYAMMGGDLSLDVSYNTADDGSGDDMDMTSLGATYNVNESMAITASQTSYGEFGFDVGSANMTGGYDATGNLGYLGANEQNRSVGITYAMGDFNLGATMHSITNTGDDDAGTTTNEDYERSVTDISLGYTLSDNANLSLKVVNDAVGDADDVKYMWLTLNVGL